MAVLHYSALQTGVAWLATSITSVALAGLSQWLVTRGGAKIVMAIGMSLIGAGVLWAAQVPVHGHFVGNLLGPFMVAGAGTAFAFIPVAIASSVAATHTQALLPSGHAVPAAFTGGFQRAFWVLGAIALPAIFALVRRDELSDGCAGPPCASRSSRSPPRSEMQGDQNH